MIFEKLPLPKRNINSEHGKLIDEILNYMQVGDSTLITTNNFNAFRAGLHKRCKGWKFTYQTISDNQSRIWRLK